MFSTSATLLLNRDQFDNQASQPHPNPSINAVRQNLITSVDTRDAIGAHYVQVNNAHSAAGDNDDENTERFLGAHLEIVTAHYNRADDIVEYNRQAFAQAATGQTAPPQLPRGPELPCNPRIEEEGGLGPGVPVQVPTQAPAAQAPIQAPAAQVPAPESVPSDITNSLNSDNNNPEGGDGLGGSGSSSGSGTSSGGSSSSAGGVSNKIIELPTSDEILVEYSPNLDEILEL